MGQITEEKSKDKGKRELEVDETENSRTAKKLLFVVFHPMVAARENGVTIPGVCHPIPSFPVDAILMHTGRRGRQLAEGQHGVLQGAGRQGR
jgi:hypothetical protein